MKKLVFSMIAVSLAMVACAEQGQPAGGGGGQGEQTGPTTVQVSALEYKFHGIPETLPAGEATFMLQNEGKQPHMISLARIKTDTPIEELVRLPQKQAQQQIEPAGKGAFAQPGKSAEFTTTLEAGRYGYVCFVEAKKGKPHAALGMFGEFTVE